MLRESASQGIWFGIQTSNPQERDDGKGPSVADEIYCGEEELSSLSDLMTRLC